MPALVRVSRGRPKRSGVYMEKTLKEIQRLTDRIEFLAQKRREHIEKLKEKASEGKTEALEKKNNTKNVLTGGRYA